MGRRAVFKGAVAKIWALHPDGARGGIMHPWLRPSIPIIEEVKACLDSCRYLRYAASPSKQLVCDEAYQLPNH